VFGEFYECFYTVLNACDNGCASRRKRMWGIALHRRFIMEKWSSLANMIPMLHREKADTFTFQHYLIANEVQLDAELVWASGRPKSLARGMCLVDIKRLARPFWSCLTAKEQEFAISYVPCFCLMMFFCFCNCCVYCYLHSLFLVVFSSALNECKVQHLKLQPNIARSLNQNPLFHGQRSPDGQTLHSVIKNAGIIWLPEADRWFTPHELLLSQAFPVRADLSHPRSGVSRRCCSFTPMLPGDGPSKASSSSSTTLNVDDADAAFISRHFVARSHSATVGQAGNSMNVTCCGQLLLMPYLQKQLYVCFKCCFVLSFVVVNSCVVFCFLRPKET
jgi:hypothetical protein